MVSTAWLVAICHDMKVIERQTWDVKLPGTGDAVIKQLVLPVGGFNRPCTLPR